VGLLILLAAVPGMLSVENDTYLLEDIRRDAPIQSATRRVDDRLGGVVGFDLIVDAPGGVLAPDVMRWLTEIEDGLRGVGGVRGVLGPGTLSQEAAEHLGMDVGGDLAAGVLLAAIRLRGGTDLVQAFLADDRKSARVLVRTGDVGSARSESIRGAAERLALSGRPATVTVRVAGLHVLAETVLSRLVAEMARSTVLAFVVIFALMTLFFRSVRLGALSMVPNFLPLLVAAGFMGYAGITIRSSMALIFAVALGIAVDDTIHLLNRWREELRSGRPRSEAIASAIRWTGKPVLLSSVVLIVGFLNYLAMGFKATQQFGIIAAVTIAAALVGDLLLLPALLQLGARRSRR
jgi:predicted RND superfamily exporter protein